jgi:hypothetical protein
VPHHRVFGQGKLVACASDLHQNSVRVSEKTSASIGRGDTSPVTMKEGLIQLNLELTDLMAECGLGDRQKRCCLGEAPEVRHLNEVLKLPQIHLPRIQQRWVVALSAFAIADIPPPLFHMQVECQILWLG